LGYLEGADRRDRVLTRSGHPMPRSRQSPRQMRLLELLIQARAEAGLTQAEVAQQLRRPQSFVSKYESGERRLDLVELIEVSEALNLPLVGLLEQIQQAPAA
jgi:ribosome-binding protein aMBF1 (putative translation factor)